MEQRRLSKSVLSLVAILVLISSLAILGCPGDDNNNRTDAAADPAALNNRAFTFADGGVFADGLAGQEVTLSFTGLGANDRTGSFSLVRTADNATASGGVVLLSCDFTVTASNYTENDEPQVGDEALLDPCTFEDTNGDGSADVLFVTNTDNGRSATSAQAVDSGTGGGGAL